MKLLSRTAQLSPLRLLGVVNKSRVFHDVCNRYDLVYFGQIRDQDEEHRLVQGVTVSAKHRDNHYCVGSINDRGVILLEREDTLTIPNSSHTQHYAWVIVQIDLNEGAQLDHVFIDGKHHGRAFYQALFAKFARFAKVDEALLSNFDDQFAKHFDVFTPLDSVDRFLQLLGKEDSLIMAHHFGHFDFEWFQDRLIIYSNVKPLTSHHIEHMIKAGLWLAPQLERSSASDSPD